MLSIEGTWAPYGLEGPPRSRQDAARADAADQLAAYREQFVVDEAGPLYMDGNSLGRQPKAAADAVKAVMAEWAGELVGGWEHWADLPIAVGDEVGRIVGAAPGQVVVGDSTTVNLYKLAMSALDARPGRSVILADGDDFPTVRYVLQGIAAHSGRDVAWLRGTGGDGLDLSEIAGILSTDVALVCLSGVHFRTGAFADIGTITGMAHEVGALVLWDLSHAAGSVPVQLDSDGVDLAVGCGYKYLNGGPGAPAWLYVRAGLQEELRSPIWGWWGQSDQFEMGPSYAPVPGVGRFQAGTPSIAGIVAVRAGIAPLLAVGMPALWAKAQALVALLAYRTEASLVPLGARLASPADPARRGAHLAVSHPYAWEADRLLIERDLVVPDFRPPDVLRLAPVPIYTRFVDVWDAVEALAKVLEDPAVQRPRSRGRVT